MTKIMKRTNLAILFTVFALVSFSFAGNAGYVKGLGIVKGNDGNHYIFVRTSGSNVDFGCTTNPTDRLWGDFYVAWNSNDVIAASELSNLQKALQNHTITLEAINGIGTNGITGSQVSLVTKWILVNP